MKGSAACSVCGCIVIKGKHYLGIANGGKFRVSLSHCVADNLRLPHVMKALYAYKSVMAFPNIPYSGTSLCDYDAWLLSALELLRSEQFFIDAAITESVRRSNV